MKWIIILLALICSSCKIDSDKGVDLTDFDFKTGDDTEIFFKNVRQSYYDLEENKSAKLNIFRFEDRLKEASHPVLNLAIVFNYLQDEATLLIEPLNITLEGNLEVIANHNNQTDTLTLDTFNRSAMLIFISDIYQHLIKGAKFQIKTASGYEDTLVSKQEREAFRLTVSDYYRLTRIY
ncbi:hypothetical protein [Fulvivirga sediminis]|uniref:Uncharacterized protein n=1 Tax=Fulvivirga sediminis TaxID=2803949 RepID=A0A937JZ05_9BACT|nr:hypothetical protein [Fulvivirga sediminis]MBL3654775.1 hypothetical protein [Fulvivirga sediminis]